MKITIESTHQITAFPPQTNNRIDVRVWKGITDQGTECLLFIHRIAVKKKENAEQFERELEEQIAPSLAIDLREIL